MGRIIGLWGAAAGALLGVAIAGAVGTGCLAQCNATTCADGCCDADGVCQVNSAKLCGAHGGACLDCLSQDQICMPQTQDRCCRDLGHACASDGDCCGAGTRCNAGGHCESCVYDWMDDNNPPPPDQQCNSSRDCCSPNSTCQRGWSGKMMCRPPI